MALMDELNAQMKQSMLAKDKVTLSVNEKIKLGHDLSEEEEKSVLATELKQRKESVSEFTKGGRDDLVQQTEAEIKVVERFLPAQLNKAQVGDIVDATIKEVGAKGKQDFGKVMKTLMPKVKGQADGSLVSSVVKEKLS